MSNGFRLGRFAVLPGERRVLADDGSEAAHGSRAFDLLLALVEHHERVVAKDELLALVWPGVVVEENNLTVQVSALRKLLGAQTVRTVSGRGYQLGLPVQALAEATAAPPTAQAPPAAAPGAAATQVANTATAAHPVDISEGPALPLPDKPSLAVLPFANLSGDPEQEYFADGVVDDIITALTRVRAFFVIARNSSFVFKGKAVDVKEVGRRLGVRYVLEGSIRRAGNRVRIVGQLVEAESGRQVWADRFEGDTEDIFELQDRITESVVGAIEPNLRLAEIERAHVKPTANLDAYDLCLRAWPHLFANSTKACNDEALGLLYRAIALDPSSSYAKAQCAFAHMTRRVQSWASPAEMREGARLAELALAEHRDDPMTLSMAGHAIANIAGRAEDGLHALDRALAFSPSLSKILMSSGWVRCYLGDADVAAEHFQRAIRLSPLDPEVGYVHSGLGFAYLIANQQVQAIAVLLKSLQEAPTFLSSFRALIVCYVELGRLDDARTVVERMRHVWPGSSISAIRALLPYKSQAFRDRYIEAHRIAGLPE